MKSRILVNLSDIFKLDSHYSTIFNTATLATSNNADYAKIGGDLQCIVINQEDCQIRQMSSRLNGDNYQHLLHAFYGRL